VTQSEKKCFSTKDCSIYPRSIQHCKAWLGHDIYIHYNDLCLQYIHNYHLLSDSMRDINCHDHQILIHQWRFIIMEIFTPHQNTMIPPFRSRAPLLIWDWKALKGKANSTTKAFMSGKIKAQISHTHKVRAMRRQLALTVRTSKRGRTDDTPGRAKKQQE